MDKYKDSFLIKIDLDMYLINELDKKLFKNTPVITTHTLGHNFYIENNLKDDFFNTGFLISKASDKFYDKQFKKLLEMEKAFFDKNIEEKFGLKVEYIRNNDSLEYCLLEEICVNYMIKDGEKIFKILNNCLEGEEDESGKIKIDNIYFIHEHLTNKKINDFQTKLKYKKILKSPGFDYLLNLFINRDIKCLNQKI